MIIHEVVVSEYSIMPCELSLGTEGSYGNEQLKFSFDDSWDGLTRTVAFYPPRTRAISVIIDNTGLVDIPHEATSKAGIFQFLINGYIGGRNIYSIPGTYKVINVPKASTANGEAPTPTEMQQALNYMQTAVDTANGVEERANNGEFNGAPGKTGPVGPKGDTGADGKNFSVSGFYSTLAELQTSITAPTPGMAYGVGTSPYDVYIYDGVTSAWINNGKLKGEDGTAATISVGTTTTGEAGTNAEVTNSGTSSEAVFNFTIPRGADGSDGVDGRDIELQKSDTYIQWRYVGGSWTNLVAMSDITGSDGDAGSDGRGISSVVRTSGTGAAGTTDTYTITFTDSTTTTFNVYNGANGTGAGDMLITTYDPQGKNGDAFSRSNHTGTQTASTISDFVATVRSSVLTGLSTATNAAIAATDTLLAALGKLQAQITGHIGSTGTAHGAATTSVAGFMSASDKSKLDGIASGANNYTHPAYTAQASGLYKVTVDAMGHISTVTAVAKADITGLGIPAQDTVYTHPAYTAQASGLYKITVDATGHISAVTAATKADITAFGITASDVGAVPVSGGSTMTGKLYAQANTDYTTYQMRNIALSTSAAIPTGTGSLLGVYT